MARRSSQELQVVTSTYEAWLHSQHAAARRKAHRDPEPDLFEKWLEQRVEERETRLGLRHHRSGSSMAI